MFDSQTPVNDSNYKYKDDPMCKNVRHYLNTNNISDGEFVKLLDAVIGKENSVGRTTVTNWKNGKFRPKEEMWNYIAQVLGISLAEFKSDDGYKNSNQLKRELEELKKQLKDIEDKDLQSKMKVSDSVLRMMNLKYTDEGKLVVDENISKNKSRKGLLITKEEQEEMKQLLHKKFNYPQ